MTPPIAFIDTETTGLDPDLHEIWEVGLIVDREIRVVHDRRWMDIRGLDTSAFEFMPSGPGWAVPEVQPYEWTWMLPVDLGRADPKALAIGRFHERHPQGVEKSFRVLSEQEFARLPKVTPLEDFAYQFAALTRGLHLAGAVVSFDEERLRKLLKANGACPEWHYHLCDVENLAAGALGTIVSLAHLNGYALAERREHEPIPIEDLAAIIRPPWDSAELSRQIGVDPDKFDRHTALGDARWAKAQYEAVMGPC